MSNSNTPQSNNSGSDQPKDPVPPEPEKSDPQNEELCRICFERLTDRSLTDSCYHPFCLNCLREWSQTHNICPFCRRGFRNILANVDSQNQFDVIPIPLELLFLVPLPRERTQASILINQLSGYNQRFEDDYQTYLQMMNSLNDFDQNSMEYIRTMQTIFTLEGQMTENRERIHVLRQRLYTELLPIIIGIQNPNIVEPNEQQINGQPIEVQNENIVLNEQIVQDFINYLANHEDNDPDTDDEDDEEHIDEN